MQVQPYLFFEGRAEEAIEFYRKTLGAEVQMLMRYKDSPEPQPKGDAQARRWFEALADGGKVQQPLIKTFFSSSFGMVSDRFGLMWMVVVPQAKN